MRHKLIIAVGLMALGWAMFAAVPAGANDKKNGPYYAMPSWDQTFPGSTRFIVLTNMNGEAVLDQETGLVWQQSPTGYDAWANALTFCNNSNTGGRLGWRLPTVQELASLVDKTQSNPTLPAGHPFSNVASSYWSATISAFFADYVWGVNFENGGVGIVPVSNSINAQSYFENIWCVRGGQGADAQ